MKRILIVLLTLLPFTTHAGDRTPPPLKCCTIDNNPNDVYFCMQEIVGDEVYLAVFAKDGLSTLRIAEIKKNGKQDTVFPWSGCAFFKTCTTTIEQVFCNEKE